MPQTPLGTRQRRAEWYAGPSLYQELSSSNFVVCSVTLGGLIISAVCTRLASNTIGVPCAAGKLTRGFGWSRLACRTPANSGRSGSLNNNVYNTCAKPTMKMMNGTAKGPGVSNAMAPAIEKGSRKRLRKTNLAPRLIPLRRRKGLVF